MSRNRRRPIHLHVMVSEEELAQLQERMAEAGVRNMGAFVRKMALNGYVLHVDLGPVRGLVSLQRRCSNNLNQVAIQANTYGGIYPQDIALLQKDYADLWGPLSELLRKLSQVVEINVGERCAAPRFARLWDIVSLTRASRRHPLHPIFAEL